MRCLCGVYAMFAPQFLLDTHPLIPALTPTPKMCTWVPLQAFVTMTWGCVTVMDPWGEFRHRTTHHQARRLFGAGGP